MSVAATKHAKIEGKVLVVGFGSIGKGTMPLLFRHIDVDPKRVLVIDPIDGDNKAIVESYGASFLQAGLHPENFDAFLTQYFEPQAPHTSSFLVNVSVEVSSRELTAWCIAHNVHYLDTVVEPWLGCYTDPKLSMSERSNYAMREAIFDLRRAGNTNTITTMSCVGANPGLISWLLKDALLALAADLGRPVARMPQSQREWAQLMCDLGVKGVHIAERDTQRGAKPRQIGQFINTWSVEGFCCEGLQPSELGWGTHEKEMPVDAERHSFGCDAAIYLKRPGAATRVRSWTPIAGPQIAFLITHDEAISIADYYTLRDESGAVVYRPTSHYAYHPTDQAILSLHELSGRAWHPQPKHHILAENEIVDGADCLGVLLYGHAKNAFWYGSELSIEETRRMAPHQNATGLQVTAAIMASIVWALENPKSGVVDANFMDHKRCLELARPYLGKVYGAYTDWNPLTGRGELFPERVDRSDPWLFSNVLVNSVFN